VFKMFDLKKLEEGVYDYGIFKAFFLAGGPGSGKSFITQRVTGGLNLKLINSDLAFEVGLRKANLSLNISTMTDEEYETAMSIRNRAKDITNLRQELAIQGRLGLVVDGTGKDYNKIVGQAKALQEIGYDTYMIFVNTSLEIALERNRKRDRTVPEEIVVRGWNAVQSNTGLFQDFFGTQNFIIVDNNNITEDILLKIWKKINKFIDEPIENYIAKQWIQKELELKKKGV